MPLPVALPVVLPVILPVDWYTSSLGMRSIGGGGKLESGPTELEADFELFTLSRRINSFDWFGESPDRSDSKRSLIGWNDRSEDLSDPLRATRSEPLRLGGIICSLRFLSEPVCPDRSDQTVLGGTRLLGISEMEWRVFGIEFDRDVENCVGGSRFDCCSLPPSGGGETEFVLAAPPSLFTSSLTLGRRSSWLLKIIYNNYIYKM